MSSAKKQPSSRYTSPHSSTSSSSHLKPISFRQNSSKFTRPDPNHNGPIVKSKNDHHNFATMVKKFMQKRSHLHPFSATSKKPTTRDLPLPLINIPSDFISNDPLKVSKKGSTLSALPLPKKLFATGGRSAEKYSTEKNSKALVEIKSNTRTLAMVLRSERELLAQNKEQEAEIAELKSLLRDRNTEVEKLKDLCLKQREEIKALKSAILFPDEMNSQLQEILDKQGSELKQAKQVIPCLQMQISSLTGQLHTLSQDLAEVKAVKYTSPTTSMYHHEEAANSLVQDFSSDDDDDDDPTTPESPNDMLLKDLNPCLTPCYSKMKSKESEAISFGYAHDEGVYEVSPVVRKVSRSSDHTSTVRGKTSCGSVPFRMSDESKYRYGKRMVL